MSPALEPHEEARLLCDAQRLLDEGKASEAVRLLEDLLEREPRSLSILTALIGAATLQKDPARAKALALRASRLKPAAIPSLESRFQCLMRLGRFSEAFSAAEKILDQGVEARRVRLFWNPWQWFPIDRPRFVKRLDALAAKSASPWPRFYRALLKSRDGFDDLRSLSKLVSKRYGWMHQRIGSEWLNGGRYAEAVLSLRAALRWGADWTARGYLSEALLCLGKTKECLKELELALAQAPQAEKRDALAWRGGVELWLGRYREAYRKLDKACALEAKHAYCWRGGAALLLGHAQQARKLLDETLAAVPADREALVWRGEAKRRLGLHREALADLDRVPDWIWARWNRAMIYDALGKEAECEREFKTLPPQPLAALRRRLKLPEDGELTAPQRRRVLETGLALAKGFRRNDYDQAAWLTSSSR